MKGDKEVEKKAKANVSCDHKPNYWTKITFLYKRC